MNPYDLYALETALRLRERCGGKVSVVSMGPPQAETVIREAYAHGRGRGGAPLRPAVRRRGRARHKLRPLAGGAQARRVRPAPRGKQTTDGDTAQVGPELAEWLGIPSVSNVRKILEIGEDGVSVEMDMPDDVERVRVRFPCLLTVDQDIFQPRLPSYVKKTESAGRPVEILTLDEMEDREETHYGLNGSPTQVQRIFPPAVNDRRELWKEEGEALSDRLYALLRDKKFV